MRRLPIDLPIATYVVAENEQISAYDMVALNADGEVVKASDVANIDVIGYAFNVTESDIEVDCGIVAFANDTTNPVTRTMRGKPCYIKDANTVCGKSTNSVPCGIVIDVDGDEVFIDNSAVALATARAITSNTAEESA